MKIGRFLSTVRWLRPTQIFGRLFNHLRVVRSASAKASAQRPVTGEWVLPACREASFSNDGQPRFLNLSGELKTPADWNATDVPRLWLYNLHYFDDLNARGADERREPHRQLISRWIDENPPFEGAGWEPYPCSLRIVNWIKWALAGNKLESNWRESLAFQAAWLLKNIEWYLLGNHLFANAKALVFAGLFFEGRDAERWLGKGLQILRREIPEQVLAGGGHFELSPMYHAIATEDMLDLINAAQAWPGIIFTDVTDDWRSVATRMLGWTALMRHPDGKIALFNDSAFGIAPDPSQLFEYANRLSIDYSPPSGPIQHYDTSGYARSDIGDAVLFADVGKIGPDYLPGHAHADTLSFELSLFGDRWFVDAGCSTYVVCDERVRQRGTEAHNTVTVDNEDSSEVWSSFRVARRAKPSKVEWQVNKESTVISASHDGYMRLSGKVIHHRCFELSDSRLEIQDRLDGRYATADANFLLHPDIEVLQTPEAIVMRRGERIARLCVDGGRPEILDSTWHPKFGLSIPAKRIRVSFMQPTLTTTVTWRESE